MLQLLKMTQNYLKKTMKNSTFFFNLTAGSFLRSPNDKLKLQTRYKHRTAHYIINSIKIYTNRSGTKLQLDEHICHGGSYITGNLQVWETKILKVDQQRHWDVSNVVKPSRQKAHLWFPVAVFSLTGGDKWPKMKTGICMQRIGTGPERHI